MADQKRWFKVWTSIVANGRFAEMTLEDIGRWTLLGAATALDGDRGRLEVPGQAKELCRLLRVDDIRAAKDALKRLRSVQFEEGENRHGELSVTWKNWQKYQEDSTQAARQKTSRSKRRGEEKRREVPPVVPHVASARHARNRPAAPAADPLFASWWAEYPRKIGQPRALKAWRSLHPDNGLVDAIRLGLTRWRAYWTRQQTPTDRIPYPATWLNDRRWEAEFEAEAADPYAKFPRVSEEG